MIINNSKISILPRASKTLGTSKSVSKLLVGNSRYTVEETNNSIHHSQKKLEVITQSNFVITRTKPIANPWNECASILKKKDIKLVRYRARLEAIVINRPQEKPKLPELNRTFNKSLNPCFKTPAKKRKNSLSGWV